MPGIPDRQRKPQTMSQQTTDVSQTPPHERNPQQPSGMPHRRYEPFLPLDLTDRTWPTKRMHEGAALVCGRPARRQPGADRPDESRAQEGDVPAAGEDGLQGDRGRLPGGQPDRLRLRPDAHRRGPDPRRRRDPGADPGPRGADRADLRVARGRQAGDRAPLQLDLHAAAARRLRHGRGRHPRHRGARRPARARSSRSSSRAPTSSTSTPRSPTPAPSSSSPSASATPSSTCGSPPPSGR